MILFSCGSVASTDFNHPQGQNIFFLTFINQVIQNLKFLNILTSHSYNIVLGKALK